MNNREAFEAWHKEKFPSSTIDFEVLFSKTFERWMSISEPYMDKEVNARFEGYQAALASQVQQTKSKPAKLERRIKRLSERLEAYKEKYYGKEQIFTYHAGYSIGYVEGQLSILEDIQPAPDGVDK